MQILRIGKIKPLFMSKQAGFTLVEIMVVLLILGVMTSAVVLNMPPQTPPLYKQGRQLAALMRQAAQSSLIERQSVGVSFTEGGYSVMRYVQNVWVDSQQYSYDLDEDPVLTLVVNGIHIDMDKVQNTQIPVIRYGNTGMATPFTLTLDNGARSIKLLGEVDGQIRLVFEGDS